MIDNFLMIVLRRRLEAIIREMINALFKSGRSGVLNTAMDFSCSLTDSKFQSISVALGLSAHLGAIDLVPRAVVAKHGDSIKPGDCFANNDSYQGNTHCADFTLCVPVFFAGRICFYAIARAHFADMGFPIPTTYYSKARDTYEEGLTLPCVRIQKDYADVPDVIDICKANIRVPEQFYGDYLACLAAVRTGEKRLLELCEKYGGGVVEEFLDKFQDYAEEMAMNAIARMPKGKTTRTIYYDSTLPKYPNGIPVTATLEVDPESKYIDIDLTDNIDNVPLGINMTECTTLAMCRMTTINVLGPEVPRCSGAFRRIRIKMREGSIIGKPRFPAATSCATTNICQAFGSHMFGLFSDISENHGAAYGPSSLPGSCPVISGIDPRKNNARFVNQIFVGAWSGPGNAGAEPWLTYVTAGAQGLLWQASVEITELQQPMIVEEVRLRIDSGGAGEFQGGPGAKVIFYAHLTPLRLVINAGGHDYPPAGVRGGGDGAPLRIWKQDRDGKLTDLGIDVDVVLEPGERLISEGCGGGGFGSPAARDKKKVAAQVSEGWITPEFARRHYGFDPDSQILN
jgi:N-methylhydantoinase B